MTSRPAALLLGVTVLAYVTGGVRDSADAAAEARGHRTHDARW